MPQSRCALAVVGQDHGVPDATERTLRADCDLLVHRVSAFGAAPLYAAYEIIIAVVARDGVADTVEWFGRLRVAAPAVVLVAVGDRLDYSHIAALLGAGAFDFVSGESSADELRARVRRSLGMINGRASTDVRAVLNPRLREFIGSSPIFARQVAKLPTIAGCDAGVLILGETGTGKEVCARAIHYLSARASKPLVAVNCAAIPTELVENELFGHVKGAYTTALTARTGLVREAEGGTLFLDDVDCLPLSAQAKLLRFLQEREYRAVGSNTVQHSDVRVIAASNRALAGLTSRDSFRADLYFRLNVLNLSLPALRERREDITELALHFMGQFARRHARHIGAISPAAVTKLLLYDWPGNVRELQHVIERAVLLSTGTTLTPDDVDIPGLADTGPADESFRAAKARIVTQFERGYIEHLLVTCGGNVTHAAKAARKDRRAFFSLMRKHGIARDQFESQSHAPATP